MLKLYIDESYLFTEAIADIKKYYPNIPNDTFMQLISLDPTYRGNDSAGKYGKWLLNLYNKGNLSEDEFEEVTPLLNQFTTYRNRIQNKDLNSYKSLDELSNVLASVINDDSMLTNRQRLRFLKNVKSGKTVIDKENDYEVVLDTPNFIVYVPNTHEAAMKLGKGTKWCTSHENPDWFAEYTEDDGKLYIVKNKKTGERWQYSDLSGDFLNQRDSDFDVKKLLIQDEKLAEFFTDIIGIDITDFDDVFTYNGGDILSCLCDIITDVVISNEVLRIPGYEFSFCHNLMYVTISNGVTEIGESAFKGCKRLVSITIPNSITKIGKDAFEDCDNLVVYTNNNYVIQYCNENNITTKPLNSNESYKFRNSKHDIY